jgi:TRAP-type uncharacterized transport system substrate-binding protein
MRTAPDIASAKRRAAVALEIAKGLALSNDRRFWQVKLEIAGAAGDGKNLALFASDNPEGIDDVVEGRAAMALINPSVVLTLAYRGTGPFRAPQPVRAIAVNPSYDLFAFVVMADTGLTSLEDVRERRFPLRISLRGQRSHSIHSVLDCVLAAAGFSVKELESWGGSIHYEPGFDSPTKSGFDSPERLKMAQNGTINAIFDEAICRWLDPALEMGMKALPLGATTVRNLEHIGFRRNVLDKAAYPLLDGDVETIDFSGFAIFVRTDAPDALVASICAGLDLRRDEIPWEGAGPLPIAYMCRDTPDGPLDVPLHPAAERYWHEHGYTTEPLNAKGQIHPRRDPPERPPRIRSMLSAPRALPSRRFRPASNCGSKRKTSTCGLRRFWRANRTRRSRPLRRDAPISRSSPNRLARRCPYAALRRWANASWFAARRHPPISSRPSARRPKAGNRNSTFSGEKARHEHR